MLKKWFKKWRSRLYVKWIKGECHRVCYFCQYKHECEAHEVDYFSTEEGEEEC